MLGFEELTDIPTTGLRAPKDTLFFSDLSYSTNQFALFGEGTFSFTPRFSVTGGLRYYHFSEDKDQIFDGIFAQDNTGTELVSQPGSTDANGVAPRVIATYKLSDNANLDAQVSKGFGSAGSTTRSTCRCAHQRISSHLAGGRPGRTSRSGTTRSTSSHGCSAATAWSAQPCSTWTSTTCRRPSPPGRAPRASSSTPDSRTAGFEVEFEAAPNRNFDFAVSATFTDAELRSTLTSTDAAGVVTVVSGIEEGRRLPTVPKFQLALGATYQWDVRPGMLGYVTGKYRAYGLAFHPGRRRGSRHARPAVVRRQHDWRAPDRLHVHV